MMLIILLIAVMASFGLGAHWKSYRRAAQEAAARPPLPSYCPMPPPPRRARPRCRAPPRPRGQACAGLPRARAHAMARRPPARQPASLLAPPPARSSRRLANEATRAADVEKQDSMQARALQQRTGLIGRIWAAPRAARRRTSLCLSAGRRPWRLAQQPD